MPAARPIKIITASSPVDFAAGAALISSYAQEFYDILCLQNINQELQELSQRYSPPSSQFFLLKEAESPVACVILKRFSADAVELKRMYIKKEARGRSYSKLLLNHAIEVAKNLGYRRMLLDTVPAMTTAIQLYEKFGFQRRDAYYDSPLSDAFFYELTFQ